MFDKSIGCGYNVSKINWLRRVRVKDLPHFREKADGASFRAAFLKVDPELASRTE